MLITGQNQIINDIFEGSYSIIESPVGTGFQIGTNYTTWRNAGIDAAGITGVTGFIQPGNSQIDLGYLESGNIPISGLSANPSDTIANWYYRVNTPIYGMCHGVGSDGNLWYSGYNFYNAFHPVGYFSPPFGENTTVVKSNDDGDGTLDDNGSCTGITADEYNDLFGIVSNEDSDIDVSIGENSATAYINSPAIACPQDISVNFYWEEEQYALIAGTALSITANTFYNSNPIPTALDNFYLKIDDRYKVTTSGIVGTIFTLNTIQYNISGQPIPNFSGMATNVINTQTCPGILSEGGIAIGTNAQSFLLDAPDSQDVESQGFFDTFAWWNLWHFLYEENSDGFPFFNSYDSTSDNDEPVTETTNNANQGSQLFEAVLSDDLYYWQRRQCPEAISMLPHTFGGAIFACPSYYFDIPYYAALKKFGFYGTRFLNGCVSLKLNNPIGISSQTPNAVEIANDLSYTTPGGYEPNTDVGINSTSGIYDNLLTIASAEENQTDFFALNTPLFLWANQYYIYESPEYQALTYNSTFTSIFKNIISQYNNAFPSGLQQFLTGNSSLFESGNDSQFYNTGTLYDFLSNDNNYLANQQELNTILTGTGDTSNWNYIVDNYGYAILQSLNNVNTGFYYQLQSGKQSRLQTRYFENLVKGNPIDLYPTNKIYFSFDKAANFINGSGWGKSAGGFGLNQNLYDTGLNRQYFLGAYMGGQNISGLETYLNNVSNISSSYFYPGYFNSNIGFELPVPSYTPVITGAYTEDNQTNVFGNGWMALGYNGVGALNDNFSCFTPIFVKQPFPRTYCKIGQSPTFRALAVDYHTIPDDKINGRYPEINYWTTRLKMTNPDMTSLYPITYKWYRILKSNCTGIIPNNGFQNFLLNPDFNVVEPSNSTGNWCAIEGDGPYCTLIHPQECIPPYPANSTWSYEFANTPMYQTALENNFYLQFKKGAILGTDDLYYYFCMARGRFGIRISEPSELFIEDWLAFDVSIQNGGNATLDIPIVLQSSIPNDSWNGITCQQVSGTKVQQYCGFTPDPDSIPEDVIQEKLPPPNAGFGDVYSYTFVGMWRYRGATQTYTPGTVQDTRGLQGIWGRYLHYGSLVQYYTTLQQVDGDAIYGRSHLPVCVSGGGMFSTPAMQGGIQVIANGYVHWANMQEAIAITDPDVGAPWNQLENAGALYVPTDFTTNGASEEWGIGVGQWQYGNNLGTIHAFGTDSSLASEAPNNPPYKIDSLNASITDTNLAQLKSLYLHDGVLAGSNCGWQKYGLGRNMIYWIEGDNAFYEYCDSSDKKNIPNYLYMHPAIRQTNSSIQYFWLGKPNNTYLDRYLLYGPYAYEWKVRRHNRDRNGNGMSQGFYSYGWNTNYSLMYDAPAIYGLFTKYSSKPAGAQNLLQNLNIGRNNYFGTAGIQSVKTTSFGLTMGNGGVEFPYGDEFVGNINTPFFPTAYYVSSGYSNALAMGQGELSNMYGCSDADLLAGTCFDPCISMRYQFGFLPGGKHQDFTTNQPSGSGYSIVPNSIVLNNMPISGTVSNGTTTLFRGAFGTPHLKYLKKALETNGIILEDQELNGFSPCFDGGADHCNYITATLNIGSSMYLESQTSNLFNNANLATQSVNFD